MTYLNFKAYMVPESPKHVSTQVIWFQPALKLQTLMTLSLFIDKFSWVFKNTQQVY